ncbi:MAG: acetyl-CoA carboxylase biotin carboxyl carrier protein [Balneolaceae bacterium]|jgi:acetyl-CoA carboxylase biotin carboxyl carrier protein|nr:MAG: acetyl-CoA carboxylase biotin carboxyl carrier protein [Balneolaceae bacterium]
MDLKLIKNLLTMISDSDVNEVSIEEGEFKIKIKKQPDVVQMRGPAPVNYMQLQDNPQASQNPANTAPAPAAAPETGTKAPAVSPSSKTIIIKSPIVGTYYEASAPDQDPFVQVGSKISKGKTLCIIEAMKIMNEIESEYDGKIVNILVKNAQPVEFDQPLFEIDPA